LDQSRPIAPRHSDEGGRVADLCPGGADENPELRRVMIGRAAKLESLGLAEQVGPPSGP